MPSEVMDSSRVVLITGSSGGLGTAVAKHFASLGSRLALFDRTTNGVGGFPATQHMHQVVDLTNRDEVSEAVDVVFERWGRIDVAVHLVGGFTMGEAVHQASASTWSQMFDINVRTMVSSVSSVVPVMQRQRRGVIVNVGAASSYRGTARMGPYIASKSAVARLTESMSDELKGDGIRVNAVLPSILDTPANRASMPDADHGKWVMPDDLAAVIGFLSDDSARAIHGACIPVMGLL